MPNLHDLYQQVGELRGEVKRGFGEITRRLDTINGRLDKHSDKIDRLENFESETKGAEKQITKLASIGGAIAGGFVTAVVWIASRLFGDK